MINKMESLHISRILVLVPVFVVLQCVTSSEWPVPYKRFPTRPQSNSFCKWGVLPFCPTGEAANTMPYFEPSDVIEIYALKKPVWQFKFGDLLGKYNIMHDAIGINNVNTKQNFTMEWYELFQLMNCTFPHVLKNNSILWCNQGATCIYRGINDKLWKQNGTLVKVATVTGGQFNQFAEWVMWDNRTGIYYETWTVKDKPGGNMWFNPFDCASWVIRAFDELGKVGANFDTTVHLNYTKITLYSQTPRYLGNPAQIFGPSGNKTLANDIQSFYKLFQVHEPTLDMLKHLVEVLYEVLEKKHFYFFYNYEYYLLNTNSPYVKITYNEVPLPGQRNYNLKQN